MLLRKCVRQGAKMSRRQVRHHGGEAGGGRGWRLQRGCDRRDGTADAGAAGSLCAPDLHCRFAPPVCRSVSPFKACHLCDSEKSVPKVQRFCDRFYVHT